MKNLLKVMSILMVSALIAVPATAQDRMPAETAAIEAGGDYGDAWDCGASEFDPFARGFAFGRGAAHLRDHYDAKKIRFVVSGALTVQQTAIGVRPAQEDAWRAYTDAVLAMIPVREKVVGMFGRPGENPDGPEAFARAEYFADALIDYADKARALKQAITDLRSTLSKEQLEAARFERILRN